MRACTMALMCAAAAGAFTPRIPTTSSPQLRRSPAGGFRGDGARLPALCSLRGGADAEAGAAADIRRNLEDVQAQVRDAAASHGRGVPRLVAVSKLMPASAVQAAFDTGHRAFGENYVQELIGKAPQLPDEVEWRFIGNLQSNKAKSLVAGVPNLAVVETVDTAKIATALNKACEAAARPTPLKVMLQVLTSGEDSKSGCLPDETVSLAEHITSSCPRLVITGLMTIGKFGDPNPEPYFECLHECRQKVATAMGVDADSLELSMGMSGDFAKAIAAGSTSVRVGTAIFGSRPPAKLPPS